ncbi:MAG TPA: methyltransferase domain-containing protein, partial [Longimicrobiaceae bacterium]|nr:methyltransferase domain-containing protein [Longimicrobiaceae bacterium]
MKTSTAAPAPPVPDFKTGFGAVDRAADPRQYIRYLDTAASSEPSRAMKRRTFDLLEVRPGMSVLDVGCGTGSDALALARLVGGDGRAVGVD